MKGKRILVVDDEPDVLDLLRDLLEQHGYQVDVAGSGNEALAQIRETIYDAALVDFQLPDMNGLVLHRQLRQMDPELAQRTVFMSGFAQSEPDMDYYSSFGSGFVAKPFDVQDVLDALKAVFQPPEAPP